MSKRDQCSSDDHIWSRVMVAGVGQRGIPEGFPAQVCGGKVANSTHPEFANERIDCNG